MKQMHRAKYMGNASRPYPQETLPLHLPVFTTRKLFKPCPFGSLWSLHYLVMIDKNHWPLVIGSNSSPPPFPGGQGVGLFNLIITGWSPGTYPSSLGAP